MDLEDQWAILRIIREYDSDDLCVILGCRDTQSTETHAETVTSGDPSLAGPLAGTTLNLPVYHILEPNIKEIIPRKIYNYLLKPYEDKMDIEAINQKMKKIRTHK